MAHIFIVDSSDGAVKLRNLLKDEGHAVKSAATFHDAVIMAKSNASTPFDFGFIDTTIGFGKNKTSGLAVFRRLSKLTACRGSTVFGAYMNNRDVISPPAPFTGTIWENVRTPRLLPAKKVSAPNGQDTFWDINNDILHKLDNL